METHRAGHGTRHGAARGERPGLRRPARPVSAALSVLLATAADAAPMTVLVHGEDLVKADGAVRSAGLTRITSFDRIGVVAARGTAGQVRAARAITGVRYLEANQRLRVFATSGPAATRSAVAQQTLTGANGQRLDGTGVSVAVIDSGIDRPTRRSRA